MSIKHLATFSLVLVVGSRICLFSADAPSPASSASPGGTLKSSPAASSSPVASPSANPSAFAEPKGKKSAAEPSPAPSAPATRAIIDSLSAGDLNDAMDMLKGNYINPGALSELELSRATLQGLIDRLSPGVSILAQPPANPEASPFMAEVLDDGIGYLRVGSLAKGNIDEMDAALQSFNAKSLKSVVLDLRATPPGSEFDMAAEVIKRFCPKGKVLFTVKKINAKQERIITSNQDPSFQGLFIVLVDKENAGAAEVIAAVLRIYANAMVIGQNTSGQAVEFSDLALHSGKILRVAVAEVVLPGNVPIFPKGVKPDIAVQMSAEDEREIMKRSLEKGGISQFVFETERTHMNEAALVAGRNPELDALEAAQHAKVAGEKPKPPLRDVVLQRAVDFVTSVGIYENRAEK